MFSRAAWWRITEDRSAAEEFAVRAPVFRVHQLDELQVRARVHELGGQPVPEGFTRAKLPAIT